MNPRLINIIKYALSLSLLAWLIIRTDLQGVFDLWPDADLQDIAVALTMYLISVVIIAYRWQILLVAKQVPMAIRRAISLYFIGNFFTNFLPTSIGGDAVRAYSAGTDMDDRMDAFASVFIERFIGLFAIVFLALLGLLLIALKFEQTYIVPLTIALFIIMAAVFPILFSRWCLDWFQPALLRITMFDIGRRATRLHEVLYKYGEHRQALIANFLLSILYQGLIVVMNIFAARALHIDVPAVYFIVFVPIIGIVSMFPFSVNAIGFREGGYIFLFDRIGFPSTEALALSLTLYAITVVSSLPGGLLFAFQRNRNKSAGQTTPPKAAMEDSSREHAGS